MKKPNFKCDLNGSVMVTSALRYALGRKTYVPSSVMEWITEYWDNFDSNTKVLIVENVLDFLYKDHLFRNDAQFHDSVPDYDNKVWKMFAVDRLRSMSYNEQTRVKEFMISSESKTEWYEDILLKLKRLESLQKLTELDEELGLGRN